MLQIARSRSQRLETNMALVLTLEEIMEFVELLTEERTCTKFVV